MQPLWVRRCNAAPEIGSAGRQRREDELGKRRTASRVVEHEFVEQARDKGGRDVRECGDRGVLSPACCLPEKSQRGNPSAEVTGCICGESDRREAPNDDAAAHGYERGACVSMDVSTHYARATSQGIVVGVERWLEGEVHAKMTRASIKSCHRSSDKSLSRKQDMSPPTQTNSFRTT